MVDKILTMKVLKSNFSVVRLAQDEDIPKWALDSECYSITKTEDELSILCDSQCVPKNSQLVVEDNWKAFKVLGPLDFSLVGILSNISKVLADASISIFAISTYDTDYILVKENDLSGAVTALANNNYEIV